ncbi:MAG TPA: diguanylate cyclase [Spirochaetota bacterium]|nr:diguanylate cyclase [Spirochaetota bacterium]
MGLLEKALNFKKEISSNGKKTIMDRITGPAETGLPGEKIPDPADGLEDAEILYLDRDDLMSVDEDAAGEGAAAELRGAEGPAGETGTEAKPKFTIEEDEQPAGRQTKLAWDDSGVLLDNLALYELSRDLLKAASTKELFDVILFSVMGQVGASSSSIMMPSREVPDEWEIEESRGVTINKDEVVFRPHAGILKELISRKEILDMDEFKDDPAYSDDYYNYISIDAKLLVPIKYNEDILGVIVLGNKLNNMDYTGEEKGFFNIIAEYSAFSYRAIRFKELNDAGGGPGSHISAVDRIRGKMAAEGGIGRVREIIQDEFTELGITGFAIFIKDENSRDFIFFTAEQENRLRLDEPDFRIPSTATLIRDITHSESPIMFNELQRSKSLIEIFTDKQLKAMSILDLFTFKLGNDLLGFIMIYEMSDSSPLDYVHARIIKFMDFIFPYVVIVRELEYRRGSYMDSIEKVFYRVNDEIKSARDLSIPVTLVLISIKNYKRYQALFGNEKVKSMFIHFEKFCRTRLSERDFSVRFDRNKILLVLPGKDKKFAVPLANTICNELIQSFSTRDVQLLVTFLTAEYPIDGKDAYGLVDAVS